MCPVKISSWTLPHLATKPCLCCAQYRYVVHTASEICKTEIIHWGLSCLRKDVEFGQESRDDGGEKGYTMQTHPGGSEEGHH